MKKQLLNQIRKGFTLIEMLIVIVIIGILLGVLIKNYSGIQAKARNTANVIALKNISDGLTRYQGDNETYPAGDQSILKSALAPYIKTVDMTKYNITYKSHNGGQNYVICTKLEKETSNPSSNSTSCPTTYDSNRADADVASKKIASDLYFVVQE